MLEGKDERKGNFVEYDGINDVLHIIRVIDDYCKPEQESCKCNTLLDRMFTLVPVRAINRIDTRIDTMSLMDGCMCYLGAAARVGFRFVKMAGMHEKPECTDIKEITTEFLPRFHLCQSYVDNECGKQMMTIIKT